MQERLDREQPGEQRYKNHTNNGYTSTGHEDLADIRRRVLDGEKIRF